MIGHITEKQMLEMLGISYDTAKRLGYIAVNNQKIPYTPKGAKREYRVEDVLMFIESLRVEPQWLKNMKTSRYTSRARKAPTGNTALLKTDSEFASLLGREANMQPSK